MKTWILIYYSRKNKKSAKSMRNNLELGGLDVFRDIGDLLAGEDWRKRRELIIVQAGTCLMHGLFFSIQNNQFDFE